MRDRRGSLYLLTGLVLGVLFGLLFARLFRPPFYFETTPSQLQADSKDQYRAMVAIAYVADGDLVRARARLNLLHDADLYNTLARQAQRILETGQSAEAARALGLLAIALQQASP